jgi:2,4-dienoyl-CoA reductase-like NADH-dependent reductase (Old Yellow Enzyme family)
MPEEKQLRTSWEGENLFYDLPEGWHASVQSDPLNEESAIARIGSKRIHIIQEAFVKAHNAAGSRIDVLEIHGAHGN